MLNELNENNLIEKSRNVVAMQCLEFGLQELKLLDVYLSCINPRDTSTREVKFSKRQYEQIIGLNEVNIERLDEYVTHLMRNEIKIPFKTENGIKIRKHILFPNALLEKNGKEWFVYLEINPRLDDVFFNIDNLGYIKYRLKYTVKLKSKYDIKLYLLLKTFEYDKPYTFKMTLDELKQKIECDKPSYAEYKNFNRTVLKPAITAINDFTDIKVEYRKPRKKSYEDEYIEFTVERKKVESKHDVDAKLEDKVQEIQEVNVIPYNIPADVYNDSEFDLEFLKSKIASVYPEDESKLLEILGKANIRYDSKKAKSPFLYYLGIVKKILEEPLAPVKEKAAEQKPNKFHNFNQRNDDIDDIVKLIN